MPMVYYKLANVYLAQHKDAEAFAAVEAGLSLGPSRVILGDIYFARKDYAKAQREFSRACEINPQNAEAHHKLGEAYYAQGKYTLAMAEFGTALFIKPNLAESYERRGDIYVRMKKPGKAIREYMIAVKINSQLPRARIGLANTLAAVGKHEEAVGQYRFALGLLRITCATGIQYAEQQQYPEAIQAFQETLKAALGAGPAVQRGGPRRSEHAGVPEHALKSNSGMQGRGDL